MDAGDSARLLDILQPLDGYVVALAEAYIDESYSDAKPRILCVAGYVFRKSRAKEFGKRWGTYLTRKKGLPFFHMVECAHGNGIFKGRSDCDEIARRLIDETKRWSAYGFAVTVDEDEYDRHTAGKHGLPENAYGFALLQAMILIRRWANRSKYDGSIAYFFEHGHKHRADAEKFLRWVLKNPEVQARYRYRAHAFVPKETAWLHPADMLAWEWRLETVRDADPSRRPARKSLVALVREQDTTMDYTDQHLESLEAELAAARGDREVV